jgi:hypothetical protein
MVSLFFVINDFQNCGLILLANPKEKHISPTQIGLCLGQKVPMVLALAKGPQSPKGLIQSGCRFDGLFPAGQFFFPLTKRPMPVPADFCFFHPFHIYIFWRCNVFALREFFWLEGVAFCLFPSISPAFCLQLFLSPFLHFRPFSIHPNPDLCLCPVLG